MPTISSVRAVRDAGLARLSGLTGRPRQRIAPPCELRKERSSDRSEFRQERSSGRHSGSRGLSEYSTGMLPRGLRVPACGLATS